MDMPGMKPEKEVPIDLSYGCLYSGWVYIALLATKVRKKWSSLGYQNEFSQNIVSKTLGQFASPRYVILVTFQSDITFQLNLYFQLDL